MSDLHKLALIAALGVGCSTALEYGVRFEPDFVDDDYLSFLPTPTRGTRRRHPAMQTAAILPPSPKPLGKRAKRRLRGKQKEQSA